MGLISPGSGVRAPPGAFCASCGALAATGSASAALFWSYSVMVITKDSESFDPGSSPGRTFCPARPATPVSAPMSAGARSPVLVAQLDKASDYESEDWGFKSLQGYVFTFLHPHVRRPPHLSPATAVLSPL